MNEEGHYSKATFEDVGLYKKGIANYLLSKGWLEPIYDGVEIKIRRMDMPKWEYQDGQWIRCEEDKT